LPGLHKLWTVLVVFVMGLGILLFCHSATGRINSWFPYFIPFVPICFFHPFYLSNLYYSSYPFIFFGERSLYHLSPSLLSDTLFSHPFYLPILTFLYVLGIVGV
jgi:hypothetical protein